MTVQQMPVNEDGARRVLDAIAEPVVYHLVGVAISEARGRFVSGWTMTGEEIPRRLPAESFDMGLFARIARALFCKLDLVGRILDGEAVAPAPVVASPLVLNAEAAERLRDSLPDPVTRNLVTAALNELGNQLAGAPEEADSAAAPPSPPFDVEFFATVMQSYAEQPGLLERLLEGQSPAQASGWDDD